MLDFKELALDGLEFEQLIRELLFNKGLRIYWSGKGPDGGKDLICVEQSGETFAATQKTWLIQCKHKAHSGNSVGISDLDDIVDSCSQHNATGYVLATSTQPSSSVVARLEGITSNPRNNITATYWDSVKIEQLLTTAKYWNLAQRFFPVSANSNNWKIYATEKPNHWVANYKGYYFHLTNRIGSGSSGHLETIANRIQDIENIKFPPKHFIRLRAVYYDDKNGGYTWYIDYMHPHNQEPVITVPIIKETLGHEDVLEDHQMHYFDVNIVQYLEHSDHYDPDHYDYYDDNIENFLVGGERKRDWKVWERDFRSQQELDNSKEHFRKLSFDNMITAFQKIPFLKIIRSENATIEHLSKFCNLRNWNEVLEETDLIDDRFFSAWILLRVYDEKEFIKLIEKLPLDIDSNFRVTKVYVFTPSGFDKDEDKMFEITFSLFPTKITSEVVGRKLLNKYFEEIAISINQYKNEN